MLKNYWAFFRMSRAPKTNYNTLYFNVNFFCLKWKKSTARNVKDFFQGLILKEWVEKIALCWLTGLNNFKLCKLFLKWTKFIHTCIFRLKLSSFVHLRLLFFHAWMLSLCKLHEESINFVKYKLGIDHG